MNVFCLSSNMLLLVLKKYIMPGREVYTTTSNIFRWLCDWLHKRLASCISSAFQYSSSCNCWWSHGFDHDKNVKPWTGCLCRGWKHCRANSWSHTNSKTYISVTYYIIYFHESLPKLSILCFYEVASFTGEKHAIEKYNSKLKIAYNSAAQQGLASGLGLGTMLFIVFGTYALAIWYGSKLIVEKGYNGGQVMTVIISIMTGGM